MTSKNNFATFFQIRTSIFSRDPNSHLKYLKLHQKHPNILTYSGLLKKYLIFSISTPVNKNLIIM